MKALKLRTASFTVFATFVLSVLSIFYVAVQPAAAAGPCKVVSYSTHARYQMATKDISKREVNDAVYYNCSKGILQENGNWIYKQGTSCYPTVVLSKRAKVVTVWSHDSNFCSWSAPK